MAAEKVIVKHKGRELFVEEDCLNLPLSHLRRLLETWTGLSPENQKLIHKGKTLKDETSSLKELGIGCGAKLMLVGTTASTVSKQEELEQAISRENSIRSRRKEINIRRRNERGALGVTAKYGFGSIEALPGLPEQGKARRILETLANDDGIKAVMEHYRWNVGSLVEMYPEGMVGVSEVCVLGLNENHGQRIRLRIRTDDIQGFRKHLSVRKTLYHELAHNVHSGHGNEFYQLMREIEVIADNAREASSRASQLGGAAIIQEDTKGSMISGKVDKLGGDSEQMHRMSTRELAARAAMKRRTREEKEIEEGCATERSMSISKVDSDDGADRA